MDISKPVGSEITSLDFSVLSPSEIRSLSVKQVTNPTVLDNLGHPISGGLYDLSLGAFLRNLCTTCGLDEKFCPGHLGHIELPVPCYNPLFFNQLYIYLRSSCLYCHHFRLKSIEVHKFALKLKLLQYGLIDECNKLDEIAIDASNNPNNIKDNVEEAEENNVLDETLDASFVNSLSNKSLRELKAKRAEYVRLCISEALSEGKTTENGTFTATVNDERKKLIHDLHQRLLSRPRCDNCGMFSPKFRKDGFTKIFETALTEKQLTSNKIKGFIRLDMIKKKQQAKRLNGEYIEDNEMEPKDKNIKVKIKNLREKI